LIANRVIIRARVVAVKDPRSTVAAEGRRWSGNIVDMVGNESYARAVVVKPGSPQTAYIEADNVHVVATVVPDAIIDDISDELGFPFLLRNVSDAGVCNS